MSLPAPASLRPVLAAVKAKPCGRPAAGLDSGCGPASDISGGNGPPGKTHKTTRSAIRENLVSTKLGAVRTASGRTTPATVWHWASGPTAKWLM